LEKFFLIEGAPSIVQSDNGKEFRNEIMKNLFKKYSISPRFGRVRHPQSQGIVERANQTLMRRLSKCLHGREARWFDSIGKQFFFRFLTFFR
jgi:transposase InsO family protein